jgi:hypothetical protein
LNITNILKMNFNYNILYMKKILILSAILIGLLTTVSCKKESGASSQPGSSTTEINAEAQEQQEAPSNEGTYTYEDSSAVLEITVSGATWSGKTVIKSGFGAAYDAENAEYESGLVKGSDLYDDSGYAKIGYVDGNSLTTSMGGQRVTLRK